MKKFIITLLVILILVVIGYTGYLKFFGDKTTHFLVVDINPSVQLGLDDDDIVTSVTPINGDADILLSDLELEGMEATDATSSIVSAAVDMGYVDQYNTDNTINVVSTREDVTLRDKLQTKITDRINNDLNGRAIYALVLAGGVTDEMKAKADELGISYGKYLLVSKLMKLDPALKEVDVAKMTIAEIQTHIKNAVQARHNDISMDKASLKTMLITQKEKIKTEYKQKVETLKETLIKNYQKINDIKNLTASEKATLKEELINQTKEKVRQYVESVKNAIQKETGTASGNQNTEGNNNSAINGVSTNVVDRIKAEIKSRINR